MVREPVEFSSTGSLFYFNNAIGNLLPIPQSPSPLSIPAPSVRVNIISAFTIRSRTVDTLSSWPRGVAPASLYPGLPTCIPSGEEVEPVQHGGQNENVHFQIPFSHPLIFNDSRLPSELRAALLCRFIRGR